MILLNCGGQRLSLTSLYLLVWEDNCLPLVKWNAKKEKNDNARPELKEKVKNIEEYDIIFIGFPNWWGTMPMPILTFLESYKLEGKIVIPFCTHGGGGEQSCFRDFVKNTSKATNKKGFITSGGAASSARPQVEKWLKEIDIIK